MGLSSISSLIKNALHMENSQNYLKLLSLLNRIDYKIVAENHEKIGKIPILLGKFVQKVFHIRV